MIGADEAPRGVHVALEQLIALRAVAKTLRPQHLSATGRMTGALQSRRHGRGVDFEEVRAYQPGDDVRTIDWRVTARSTEPYIKVFREDREQPLLLLVDQSQSMFFGSRCCYKSVQGAHVAALLAWAGLHQGHPVGGLTISGDQWHAEAPRRGNHSSLRLLHRVASFNQSLQARGSAALELSNALSRLGHIAPAGSLIWLLSDFRDLSEASLRQLSKLAARHDLVIVRISDVIERELELSGTFTFSDPHGNISLALGRKSRQLYREQRAAHEQSLSSWLAASATPLIDVDTADAPLAALRGTRP